MQTPTNLTAAPFQVYEIAKVRYRHLLVKIFSGSSDSNPRQFFFEPLVLLDPKSIVSRSHGSFNQNFIRFTLQMWNEDLRSKVLERLRSLESLGDVKIGEEDVCVMPFKEVQLVCRPNGISQYIRLVDQPTSYLRSNENLDFYLLCDVLSSSVDVLAKDFRQNTEFTLNGWQLKLECRGLSIKSGASPAGSALSEYPTFSFNITVNPNESIGKWSYYNHFYYSGIKIYLSFTRFRYEPPDFDEQSINRYIKPHLNYFVTWLTIHFSLKSSLPVFQPATPRVPCPWLATPIDQMVPSVILNLLTVLLLLPRLGRLLMILKL